MPKIKFKPKAVIFDMDGVIVDSMPYHFLAWYEALRPYGLRVNCFDVYAREGERWEKTLKDLLTRAGIEPTPKILSKIFSRRQRIFRKFFRRYIFSGAKSLLLSLRREGYALCLVTGSPAVEVMKILPQSLISMFNAIVSGDQVKRGKPDPEPYLKAAKLLGFLPGQCLVVENAPLGIESAKKAGMSCIAVTTSLPKEYLKQADAIIHKIEDISNLVCLPKE